MYCVIFMVEAFILIRVSSGESLNFIKTVKEEITRIKSVKEVHGVLGRHDFVVRVETKSLEDLGNLVADKMKGIQGISTTETLVVGF